MLTESWWKWKEKWKSLWLCNFSAAILDGNLSASQKQMMVVQSFWCLWRCVCMGGGRGAFPLWLAVTMILNQESKPFLIKNSPLDATALTAIQTELVLTLLHPFSLMCQWDERKTRLQLVHDWQGNFRCSAERGFLTVFPLCRKYEQMHIFEISPNPRVFLSWSSILQTNSNSSFQSLLHLMDGLDIKPIQFACYAVVYWVKIAGFIFIFSWDESLRCRGTGCQNRRCLPLKEFSKVNLAESKVEKLSCLTSLLNSSRHVTLLFLFLHVLSVFEWITEHERCRQGAEVMSLRMKVVLDLPHFCQKRGKKLAVFIMHVSAAARTTYPVSEGISDTPRYIDPHVGLTSMLQGFNLCCGNQGPKYSSFKEFKNETAGSYKKYCELGAVLIFFICYTVILLSSGKSLPC